MGKLYIWIVIFLHLLWVSAHKSVVDFDDGDMERLFQQWEENDDDDDDDDTKQANGHVESNNLDEMIQEGKIDPQNLLKQSKKGKPVMIFVGVRGTPDRAHTEEVSSRWMQSLHNAHITVQRYIVAPDRVLFMVDDGGLAWNIKNYLTSLTECTTVSFEQLSFDCNTKNEL